ncbi:MAG: EutN/CcmL family microcompartment protein [Rhodothermales bacterium]
MNLGRVIGNIWATQKYASLEARRMLVVQPLTFTGEQAGAPLIALDTVDAGEGDVVIYSTASEAAIPFRPGLTPTDATIVGVVERVDHQDQTWHTA